MTDHVYKRFSYQIEGVQALMQKDATFREICADYEEICTWLACQDCPEGPLSQEVDYARELMQDLEDDIEKALKDAGLPF